MLHHVPDALDTLLFAVFLAPETPDFFFTSVLVSYQMPHFRGVRNQKNPRIGSADSPISIRTK
jgi:hypothetical protein